MNVTQKIKMDLLAKQNIQTIHAVQDDTNSRAVQVSLFEGGVPWQVPENSKILVGYLTENGSSGVYDTLPDGSVAATISENKITFVLVPAALYPGSTKVTIVIADENENQISTFPVAVEVEANYSYGASAPEAYINLGQWLSASISDLIGGVRYDGPQELTDEQKAQARENIGAVDESFVNESIESSRYETVLTTIDPTETLEAYILLQNTGALTQLASGDKSFIVKKYDVAEITTVAITASASYSAYLYSFCGASGGVIELSEPAATGSTVTEIVEQVVQVPENAAVLYVSYIVSASNVATVQNVEQKLIGDTSKWSGKKWVCIGDSLTEVNIRTTMHYHDYVAEATGISVVNLGVSGTGYAKGSNTFNSRIDSVPTDADVVTIFGSGNDLSAGIDLGEITDTGTETLCGCINTTIDSLIARMPAVQLGIVTPTPWVGQQPGAGKPMEAYANAIVEICKARSIPCLDLYHCSNLRPWTEEGRAACYSKDDGNGVHPDETGHKLIAPRFKAFLESLLM